MDSFQEHIDYGNFNELPVWGLFLEEIQPVLAVQPHGMNVGLLVNNLDTLRAYLAGPIKAFAPILPEPEDTSQITQQDTSVLQLFDMQCQL